MLEVAATLAPDAREDVASAKSFGWLKDLPLQSLGWAVRTYFNDQIVVNSGRLQHDVTTLLPLLDRLRPGFGDILGNERLAAALRREATTNFVARSVQAISPKSGPTNGFHKIYLSTIRSFLEKIVSRDTFFPKDLWSDKIVSGPLVPGAIVRIPTRPELGLGLITIIRGNDHTGIANGNRKEAMVRFLNKQDILFQAPRSKSLVLRDTPSLSGHYSGLLQRHSERLPTVGQTLRPAIHPKTRRARTMPKQARRIRAAFLRQGIMTMQFRNSHRLVALSLTAVLAAGPAFADVGYRMPDIGFKSGILYPQSKIQFSSQALAARASWTQRFLEPPGD